MKLSGQKEWLVIGALIVYIAFFPPFEPIRQALKTSIGKAVMLAAIVYTWKYWSPLVALLFAINYLRCAGGGNIWEMFSGAEAECTCEGEGFVFDQSSKKCMKGEEEGKVAACSCASGYAWDVTKKQCVVNSGTQPPVPPSSPIPMPSPPSEDSGSPVKEGYATSTAPATTPGAAQEVVNTTPTKTESFSSGPVPMLEAFKTQYSAL
jgi:hypothetical protein